MNTLRVQSRYNLAAMKKYLLLVLFFAGCLTLPLSAAELVSINNVTLVEADLNDGDSFKVNADGRELHLRLYYVDCLETTYNSKPVLERIREQQHHFGLEDPHDVVRYGEQAAEYVKQVLSQPFTIYTSYAQAPGRSALVRYYAFIETHDGRDLGHLLIEQGLARIHGKTRPSPDGVPSHTVLEKLQDLRIIALLNRSGIWQSTQPGILAEMRERQREEAQKLKEFRQKVAKVRTRDDQPLNLNSASKKELQQIPGVGPVTAIKITDGRPYQSVDDLLEIPGIGPKTVEAISPYVTVRTE